MLRKKLTTKQIIKIKELREEGKSLSQIKNYFYKELPNLHVSTVYYHCFSSEQVDKKKTYYKNHWINKKQNGKSKNKSSSN